MAVVPHFNQVLGLFVFSVRKLKWNGEFSFVVCCSFLPSLGIVIVKVSWSTCLFKIFFIL